MKTASKACRSRKNITRCEEEMTGKEMVVFPLVPFKAMTDI